MGGYFFDGYDDEMLEIALKTWVGWAIGKTRFNTTIVTTCADETLREPRVSLRRSEANR